MWGLSTPLPPRVDTDDLAFTSLLWPRPISREKHIMKCGMEGARTFQNFLELRTEKCLRSKGPSENQEKASGVQITPRCPIMGQPQSDLVASCFQSLMSR